MWLRAAKKNSGRGDHYNEEGKRCEQEKIEYRNIRKGGESSPSQRVDVSEGSHDLVVVHVGVGDKQAYAAQSGRAVIDTASSAQLVVRLLLVVVVGYRCASG